MSSRLGVMLKKWRQLYCLGISKLEKAILGKAIAQNSALEQLASAPIRGSKGIEQLTA